MVSRRYTLAKSWSVADSGGGAPGVDFLPEDLRSRFLTMYTGVKLVLVYSIVPIAGTDRVIAVSDGW